VVLAGTVAWALVSTAEVAVRAVTLTGVAFLVATPVQPWYGLLLVVLAVLAARPAWLAVAVAAYPAYFSVLLRDPRFLGIGQLGYLVGAGVVLLGVVLRRSLDRRRVDGPGVTAATGRQPIGGLPTKSLLSTAAQRRSSPDTDKT
jgi:hypothetical protein